MGDANNQAPGAEGDFEIPAWDPLAILGQRAGEAAADRDAAVADLRESMSDDEALSEFGLDLREIED